ncbi:insulinase family protein [Candidatus Woesearchaeota archaeon]|nr:insulinase family protein [Candidatus Woesearchaeota archaeon]
MKKIRLKNKLTVILEKKPTDTVTVQATVKVGSNDENKKTSGISHFIEHMLFEGTKKRPDSRIISNEIESIGGELNAYTSNERTCFYVKVPSEHQDKALDIISDIMQNPLFEKKKIEKERKIILKEIKMHKDEPRFHQWILFTKALFRKHPAGLPTYGSVKAVKGVKRDILLKYYNKYYAPNNMVLSITGEFDSNVLSDVKKKFSSFRAKKAPVRIRPAEPKKIRAEVKKEKRKILSSYMVLGYQTAPRTHPDSYTLDVIKAVLGRGQSGKMFDEIRNKRGLAYEVGVHHDPSSDYGFFVVYLNTDKKNISKVTRLILREFGRLKSLTEKEIDEAKGFLIGQHILEKENTQELADELGYWESIKDAGLLESYIREIKKVRKKDIVNAAKRYLDKNYTLAVIEQS